MSINLSGRALKRLRLPVVNYYSSAYQVMSAQAGDVNTRYLDVVLYDDRGDIDLSAYSKVYLQVQAYDGNSPQMSAGWIDTERNRAVCRLTSSMLQYTGSKMPCNIWLVGTDADDEPMSLTSQTFYVMVYEGHGGVDAEPSEDELTALQSAINDVIDLEKDVEEAEAIRQDSFRSVYIKYSFYADGTDFTDTWQDGQGYMGVSNSKEEPDNAKGYSWIPLFAAGGSSGGDQATAKMLEGFERDAGSVKKYVDDNLSGKVDAEEGMGLSSNDFTDAQRIMLDAHEQSISRNTDDILQVRQTADELQSKLDGFEAKEGSVMGYIDDCLSDKSDIDHSHDAIYLRLMHNVATDAHNDIRLLLQGLDARLTALADSDDTTLDQLSELVAYIKANRGLIESVTTDKVNVTDIINNLTTNAANKPLSAAQGVALKALIDDLASSKADSASVATAISTALAGYAKTSDIPTALKNPNALTICGKTYDGSAVVTVTTDEIVAAVVAALPDWEVTSV